MSDTPTPMKQVFSSNVSKIGYDAESGDLLVQYTTGKLAAYEKVPAALAQDVMSAASIGSAVNSMVKGKFKFRYM